MRSAVTASPCGRGVARFANTGSHWTFEACGTAAIRGRSAEELREADGYLGGFGDTETRRRLAWAGVPAVDLLHGTDHSSIPVVRSDERAIGRLAFEHFHERRIVRLACVEQRGLAHSERADAFARAAADHHVEVRRLTLRDHVPLDPHLDMLARPVGVLGTDDAAARSVLAAADRLGLRVPDDVAVLGVNDSLLSCAFANPPLSSVRPDWERIGYEGASLLRRLMQGDAPPADPVLIPPQGVTTRRSTDMLAIDDADVAAAVRWIRDHADQPANVGDLLAAVPVARRSLERKFRATFGRSPFQELRRQQAEHVKRLLIHTDWPMPRVAAASAFRDAKDLATQFRKIAHTTPTAFRAQYRSR